MITIETQTQIVITINAKTKGDFETLKEAKDVISKAAVNTKLAEAVKNTLITISGGIETVVGV